MIGTLDDDTVGFSFVCPASRRQPTMNATDRKVPWICGVLMCILLFSAACQPVRAPAVSAPPATAEAEQAETAAVETMPTPVELTPEKTALDSETVKKIEAVANATLSMRPVPGIAVCAVKDGRVVYANGFGVAETGTNEPVTAQSLFQLMDTGRTLVAVAVMQLVEQGKVDLDAPITDYLPYFEMQDERYKQITVRHLLTSSSGLPIPHEVFIDNWTGKTAQYDDSALERTVRSLSDLELHHDPGRVYTYSNFDYELLGDLVAKVSGQTFESYMQEHILSPLGMIHSTYLPKEADPALLVSPHMNKGKDVYVSDVETDGRKHGPSLGLWSSSEDMCRWMMANINRGELDGQRVLNPASYDLIWAPVIASGLDAPYDKFGMGWYANDSGDHLRIAYQAMDIGFNTAIQLLPDEKMGVVVLVNLWTSFGENGSGYALGLSDHLLTILRK